MRSLPSFYLVLERQRSFAKPITNRRKSSTRCGTEQYGKWGRSWCTRPCAHRRRDEPPCRKKSICRSLREPLCVFSLLKSGEFRTSSPQKATQVSPVQTSHWSSTRFACDHWGIHRTLAAAQSVNASAFWQLRITPLGRPSTSTCRTCRLHTSHTLVQVRLYDARGGYSGIFPFRLYGKTSHLPRIALNEWHNMRRVCAGSITASRKPRASAIEELAN